MRIRSPYQFGAGFLLLYIVVVRWYSFATTGELEFFTLELLAYLTIVTPFAIVDATTVAGWIKRPIIHLGTAIPLLGLALYEIATDNVPNGIIMLIVSVMLFDAVRDEKDADETSERT